jgi:glyoxylase-like metal-dependent hydrolase (beta-lactamase superfamily II)
MKGSRPVLGICVTCGVQYTEASPPRCPICEDPRQYVPEDGQAWTTLEALRADHRNVVRDEGALVGIGTEPRFAIGQRALLVPYGERNVLWDCITLLDDATAEEVERRGGLAAIAISHPHYYSAMVEWGRRFGCPVLLHEADREWVMRPDDAIELWSGETYDLGDGLTLLRLGGHFEGGTVLHRDGMLLSGDIVQVIPDRSHVSFMYSYPNLIPLPAERVRAIAATLEPYAYSALYGAWWGTVIRDRADAVVQRSARRYVEALHGKLP